MAGKFEVYKDKGSKFRFRLKASNGQIIGTSQAYKAKSGAVTGIKSVQKNAAEEGQYEFKKSKGKVYFNLLAKNKQVILSSQGYKSETGAKSGVKSVMNNAADAAVVDA